jgi:hypothetical protein
MQFRNNFLANIRTRAQFSKHSVSFMQFSGPYVIVTQSSESAQLPARKSQGRADTLAAGRPHALSSGGSENAILNVRKTAFLQLRSKIKIWNNANSRGNFIRKQKNKRKKARSNYPRTAPLMDCGLSCNESNFNRACAKWRGQRR